MHNCRKIAPLLQSASYSQIRHSATAASLKSRTEEEWTSTPPAPPSRQQRPAAKGGWSFLSSPSKTTSKWGKPADYRPPASAHAASTNSAHARPHSSAHPQSPTSSQSVLHPSRTSGPRTAMPAHFQNTSRKFDQVAARLAKSQQPSRPDASPRSASPVSQAEVIPRMSSTPAPSATTQQPSHVREPLPHMVPRTESQTREKLDAEIPAKPQLFAEAVLEFETLDNTRSKKYKQRVNPHKGGGSLLHKLKRGSSDERAVERTETPALTEKRQRTPKQRLQKRVRLDVYIPTTVAVERLAKLLAITSNRLIRTMQQAGLEEEASPNYLLKSDYAALLAEEFGFNPIVSDERSFDIYPAPEPVDRSSLPLRPPIVTIMGHVDHGKTTLLDTLRSTSVAKGEAGGITQHIGAFSVPVKTSSSDSVQSITFLDTPGHAAFSAMRARGASVTDIVVLVVAADDGIMPQTREVLDLVKKEQGKVGLVVAINKVDKPDVDPEDAMKELMMEGVELEQFGGNVPAVCISALTGSGLPELVDTLAVVAEMQDLRAECEGNVQGYVLESNVHKGLGNVTTVLVVRGCLKPGAHLICGTHYAKVRLMQDPNGVGVKAAYPGMAITVSGWKTLPNAGDEVLQGTESDVKKAISNREHQAALTASLEGVEALNEVRRADKERRDLEQNTEEYKIRAMDREAAENEPKELCLIIKADVSGSAEAVAGALQGIGNHLATSKVVSSGVGSVTESDIEKAQVIGGSIVAFSVDVHRSMQLLAERHSVEIISSPIIYRLMDNVRERVIKLLPPIIEVSVLGEATVVQTFDLSGKSARKIAGCRVGNGMIKRDKYVKVIRGQTIIYEGSLDTMRQVKKDVMEVRKGMECGLGFPGFNDVREGDFIQSYEKIEKPGVL